MDGATRREGPRYNIYFDGMSWDEDDDNIDSTEDLFVDDEVIEERRVSDIRRARVLRDDVEDDD